MSDNDAERSAEEPPPKADNGSIRASVSKLVASARDLAEAELAWAKLRGAEMAHGLRKWLILTAMALIFLVLGVTVLVVSGIIALAAIVGWLLASLIVAGVSILIAVLLALLARNTFTALFSSEDD